jgi:hypothetical protein
MRKTIAILGLVGLLSGSVMGQVIMPVPKSNGQNTSTRPEYYTRTQAEEIAILRAQQAQKTQSQDTSKSIQQSDVLDFSKRHDIPYAKLVSNYPADVTFLWQKSRSYSYDIYSSHRNYNICVFDAGERLVTLITKTPIGLVPYANYNLSYFEIKKDITLDAQKFVNEFVGKDFTTIDNYPFDKNIEGVIEDITQERKNSEGKK